MKIYHSRDPDSNRVMVLDLEGNDLGLVMLAAVDDEGDHNGFYIEHVRAENNKVQMGAWETDATGRNDRPMVMHLWNKEFDVVDRVSGLVLGGHRRAPSKFVVLSQEEFKELSLDDKNFLDKVQQMLIQASEKA